MSSVDERTDLATEQELLEQAVRRLAQVAAKLDADGPVVTGSQGQPRLNPLLTVEQRLREEVNDRPWRVKQAGYRVR